MISKSFIVSINPGTYHITIDFSVNKPKEHWTLCRLSVRKRYFTEDTIEECILEGLQKYYKEIKGQKSIYVSFNDIHIHKNRVHYSDTLDQNYDKDYTLIRLHTGYYGGSPRAGLSKLKEDLINFKEYIKDMNLSKISEEETLIIARELFEVEFD